MSILRQSAEDGTEQFRDKDTTMAGSSKIPNPLPFRNPRFRQMCIVSLPWNNDDITSFMIKHALPYLKHWKVSWYNDLPLRSTLSSLPATQNSFEATRSKILDVCTKHEGSLLSPRLFASLPAGPIRYVARTAVSIHPLCFSKLPDWAAAFILNDDAEYAIGVELLLEMFKNLETYGSKSWFHLLLEIEPKFAVPETVRDGIGRKGKLGVSQIDEQVESVERSPKKPRIDEPMRERNQEIERPAKKAPAKRQVDVNMKSNNATTAPRQDPSATLTTTSKKPDGRDLVKTRARNARHKAQKKLKRFKAVGLVRRDAKFAILRAKQVELKADREKTSESAKQKAAEKARREEEAEAQRPKRLRVTLKFTGHRKELLREILLTGRAEAMNRNELAKMFPHYLGERAKAEKLRETIEREVKEEVRLEDWDELRLQQAREQRGARKKLKQTQKEKVAVAEEGGGCVLGAGCERKTTGGDCVMCSAFGKV